MTGSVDEVFCREGAAVIQTPVRTPKANAMPSGKYKSSGESVLTGRRYWVGATLCESQAYVRHYHEQTRTSALRLAFPTLENSVNVHAHRGGLAAMSLCVDMCA